MSDESDRSSRKASLARPVVARSPCNSLRVPRRRILMRRATGHSDPRDAELPSEVELHPPRWWYTQPGRHRHDHKHAQEQWRSLSRITPRVGAYTPYRAHDRDTSSPHSKGQPRSVGSPAGATGRRSNRQPPSIERFGEAERLDESVGRLVGDGGCDRVAGPRRQMAIKDGGKGRLDLVMPVMGGVAATLGGPNATPGVSGVHRGKQRNV